MQRGNAVCCQGIVFYFLGWIDPDVTVIILTSGIDAVHVFNHEGMSEDVGSDVDEF